MTQSKHILEIYEPYEYSGPNPIVVSGISTITGPTGDVFFLLDLPSPLELKAGCVIEQILVLPRYGEDHIDRATTSSCTVNICCVRPGNRFNGDQRFEFEQAEHWGVGKITPAPP